ncbi:aspartyl protease family protein [Fulvivirga lutea]|uniref:Aspartyl protease family protein n=1 Tax=Fulvivirga lutea TaxID=2810512 RepID=A0A975A177_9BACT|nr:aspartyl protease family protein [Fulvivirga lutea]QSE98154.1 aspartyl protease family protein [Fulvivirga lutea]
MFKKEKLTYTSFVDRKAFLLLITLFIGFVQLNAQTLGFRFINDQKRVRIPFELYNNLIVVPVILNNQLPLKFILDTGVRTTILTEKAYTDILNLSYSKKYTIAGIGDDVDEGIEAYITNGVSLTLPGVKGTGHAMLVLEEDYLELRNYLGTDVHGVLGYEIFSRFVVKVDYDNKMLMLTTPEYFHPSRKYDELDLSVEDTKPYLTGTIQYENQEPINLKLMVDSGASHGLLLDTDSDEKLFVPEKNLRTNLGRGLAGDMYGKIARIEKLEIGNRSWKNPLATFPDGNDLLDSLKGSNVFRHGSIGGGILTRFKVIFDFPEEKIYLKKGRKFKSDFTYNLSGIIVKAKGSRLNTFEIVEIRPGSAGEKAGFQVGDQIISVDNIDKSRLNLELINGMLNSRENKKVRIEVARGQVHYSARFRLKSQI